MAPQPPKPPRAPRPRPRTPPTLFRTPIQSNNPSADVAPQQAAPQQAPQPAAPSVGPRPRLRRAARGDPQRPYAPGERLPTQRSLAADLDVNMASVREALKRLEQLRLVEVRHGDATRVLDWRSSGGLEALAALGAGDAEVIRALFEARRLLLVEAARLAAERRTDAQAERICELAEAIAIAPSDDAALIADWEFMSAVIEAAGNLVFQLIMNSVRELYLPNADAFAAVVADRQSGGEVYERSPRRSPATTPRRRRDRDRAPGRRRRSAAWWDPGERRAREFVRPVRGRRRDGLRVLLFLARRPRGRRLLGALPLASRRRQRARDGPLRRSGAGARARLGLRRGRRPGPGAAPRGGETVIARTDTMTTPTRAWSARAQAGPWSRPSSPRAAPM